MIVGLAALPAWSAEGRRPVWVDGTILGVDGHYIVTRDIVGGAAAPIITIASPNVTLDLNGFTLDGSGSPFAVIDIVSPVVEVTIRNGTIIGGTSSINLATGLVSRTVIIEDIQSKDATADAIHLEEVRNPEVRRNNIIDAGGAGIALLGFFTFKNGHVDHNSVNFTGGAGIHIQHTSSMSVRHNRIEVPSGDGIFVDDSLSCLVGENLISDADGVGIILGASRACKIYNNVINRGETIGMLIDPGSTDNLILDNIVRESGLGGAPVHGVTGGFGMVIDGFRNHIERNTVNFNDGCGMFIAGGDNVYGRNTALGNDPTFTFICGGCAGPVPPDVCDIGPNTTWGDNFASGGAAF
jgi:parallel beta-helix repeat protein